MTALGLALAGFGAFLYFCAVAMAINTSMGGTRSDYNDGSGYIAGVSILLGVAGLTWELINWISS